MCVVDGDFDLLGKIRFGNHQLLKSLGYKADQLVGKLVHVLMPRCIADIHNHFWRSFARVGEPKVLDRVRFLYVKDSKDFVHPFKVLIKF